MKSDDVNRMVEVMTTNKMRERTRQLAEQAGFVLWYGAARKYRSGQIAVDWANNYDDELEKFAELVRADEREAEKQDLDDDIYDIWVEQKPVHTSDMSQERVDETPTCKDDPRAPHGFDRNASHSADRYVCECEGWEPPKEWVGLTDEERGVVVNANFGIGVWEMAKAIEAKLKEKNGG